MPQRILGKTYVIQSQHTFHSDGETIRGLYVEQDGKPLHNSKFQSSVDNAIAFLELKRRLGEPETFRFNNECYRLTQHLWEL